VLRLVVVVVVVVVVAGRALIEEGRSACFRRLLVRTRDADRDNMVTSCVADVVSTTTLNISDYM